MKGVRIEMKKVQMKGVVVPNDYKDVFDWMNQDSFSPLNIQNQLDDADGEDITLEINSPGGYVDAGSEIYTALKEYPGKVTANIVGQACSAASWIALAADHVAMSPTAQMMIHRASGSAQGNVDDVNSQANALNELDQSFVDLYAKRTGKTKDEIYDMMKSNTWMNAKTAKANGFIDEIMFENEAPTVVNATGGLILNDQMISKIKNLLHSESSDDTKPTKNKNEKQKTKGQSKKDLSLLLWE